MNKCLKLTFFLLINFVLYSSISANYTIYLYVSRRNDSGSTASNYIVLTGNKGNSPETVINRFQNGSLNTAFLKDGQLSVIENKFPDDYGYINKVTVGNLGDSLTMQALNILDLVRNIWSNMTFVYPNGSVQAGTSSDFLYTVNGSWSSWSNWGACSATCGGGNVTRQRSCNDPPPANGGTPCSDVGVQTQSCGNTMCPFWTMWSSWSMCSTSCGTGTKERSRNCSDASNGGYNCAGLSKEVQICPNNPQCPVNGQWSDWGNWSSCSVTCGSDGVQRRNRSCNNPAPVGSGDPCQGSPTDVKNCTISLPVCPINGNWSEWSNWSSCSVTCGRDGVQRRNRVCNNPAPVGSGDPCQGSPTDVKNCTMSLPVCPVNGNWSEWSNWSSCSVTCGDDGVQRRNRVCNNPAPVGSGDPCQGSPSDVKNCTISLPSCLNFQKQAENIISDSLSVFNQNNTNVTLSVKETMNIAFDVVNKIQNALKSSLANSTGPVIIETKQVTVGLQNLPAGNTTNVTLSSKEKGKIAIDSPLNLTTGSTATFSALQSSTFFSSSSLADTSAAMLSLSIQDLNKTTALQVSVSLPNQNKQTEADLLSPVTFQTTNQIIQTLSYESQNTFYKVSMDLSNITDFTILFSISANIPNKTADSDAFIYVANNALNLTTPNLQLTADLDSATMILRINIPPNQITPPNNLTMVMFTSTNSTYVTIQVGVASITPREWNFDLEVWQDSDAEVDDTSDISNVNFKSNFLGTFSAKIFIAPNTINFRDVFANFGARLADSFVVLLVIILIYIFWIILIIIMWRKDRKEATLLRYEPLLDNDSEFEYSYIIRIHTGSCRDAGTSSDVFLNLLGKWGSSGHRKILDGYRTGLFETGTVCNFVMTTESSLGDLIALRVWHNASGDKPSWNLEKIVIEDIQTNKMYIFMCETWLSDKKFDGNTERVLLEIKRDQKFQNLFYQMKVSGVMDKHIISGITRNTGISSYTRVQKVSVFITMFFLIMVSNAMFFGKDQNLDADANFKIDMGIISITWFQFYTGMISVLITYPCIFVVTEIFRRTKKWKRRWTEDEEAKLKKLRQFPKGFIFIGWFLLILALAASSFFTFLYSLQWGGTKSNQWLESFFVGVFGMVLFSDPIILLIIYLLAKKLMGAVSTDQEVNINEFVNEDLKKILGASNKPPEQEKLEKIKKEKETSDRLSKTIQDTLMYALSLLLLTALAYDARDQTTFFQTDMIKSRFINAQVNTYNDFYPWALGILDEAYPTTFYNNKSRNGDLKTAIAICDCLRQGPFRLRQIRVLKNTCTISQYISKAYGKVPCNENYNILSQDKNSYSIKWGKLSAANLSVNNTNWNRNYLSPTQTVINAFLYQNETQSGGYPFEGLFGYYEGGGHIAALGMKRSQAEYIIRNLQINNWLDKWTRAVFFEGTIYNGNTNLFTTIQVLFEQPNSGGFRLFPYGVRSYRLYNYLPGNMIVLLSMQILYALTVVLNIYREIKNIRKQGKAYFSSNWNKLAILSIMISIAIIICTAVRIMVTINAITMLNVNKGYYVSFDMASSWLETSCILMAISSFISIIRVLKYMGFNKYISIMQGTIVRAYTQLNSLGVMFICFLIGFIATGHILFSLNNFKFADLLRMVVTLFGVFSAIINYPDMFETPLAFDSAMYFYLWSALSVFFISSVFICILNDTYSETINQGSYDYDKELVDHAWQKFSEVMNGLKSSMKYTVPDVLKKKTIAPVDMDDIDMQMSSRENVRQISSKRMNPSLRRKLAELNGEKFDTEKRENNNSEEIYINPISFTDIRIASSDSQILDDKTFAERLPRYRAKGNNNTNDNMNNPLAALEPMRPMKPNPKIDFILEKRKQSRQRRASRPKR